YRIMINGKKIKPSPALFGENAESKDFYVRNLMKPMVDRMQILVMLSFYQKKWKKSEQQWLGSDFITISSCPILIITELRNKKKSEERRVGKEGRTGGR